MVLRVQVRTEYERILRTPHKRLPAERSRGQRDILDAGFVSRSNQQHQNRDTAMSTPVIFGSDHAGFVLKEDHQMGVRWGSRGFRTWFMTRECCGLGDAAEWEAVGTLP